MSIESIEARVEAATEGPWEKAGGHPTESGGGRSAYQAEVYPPQTGRYRYPLARCFVQNGGGPMSLNAAANAAFIAHSRTDIPLLLAVAKAAKAVLDFTGDLYSDKADPLWSELDGAIEHLESDGDANAER